MMLRYLAVLPAISVALAQTLTGQFDCMPAGNFQLCQNLWGECKLAVSTSILAFVAELTIDIV